MQCPFVKRMHFTFVARVESLISSYDGPAETYRSCQKHESLSLEYIPSNGGHFFGCFVSNLFHDSVSNIQATWYKPVPVAARSKALVHGHSPAEIVGFESNRRHGYLSVNCECCVLSGRGLRDELITRPEESYRLWCVVVCDLET